MDKVVGPLELSQAKLGAEVVEIGCPALIPVSAHGREGGYPTLVEILDAQAFKSSAKRE
jgi:hypothetical protein